MKLVCSSCGDRRCIKYIVGRQPSAIEIQEMNCDSNGELDCEFSPYYGNIEDEFLEDTDFLNEVDLHGDLYV